MPSPSRLLASLVAASVAGGLTLGLLPPAVGRRVPPTVVRTVHMDERRLLPDAGAALTPSGAMRAPRTTWGSASRVCAPFTFTMVGFVWGQDGDRAVRTRLAWSGPDRGGRTGAVADPDEGPDPGSPEGAGLMGTPPVWTGEARCARLRLRLPAGTSIGDVRAVFVNTSGTAREPSFLDRAGAILAAAWGMTAEPFTAEPASAAAGQPRIITRAGWGARERMRRCEPDYAASVEMAYVHHTVNGNRYSRKKADDLIRGIYAYHVRGRKFCDIAYNFLIDRFGRIYEGRFGGMDQPVIGAHAMGFNTGSTGVAALGDFTSARPKRKVIKAYRRLLAWRLDVAHVRPTGTARMTSGGGPSTKFDKGREVTLPAIAGHRDTGYTSCPGRLSKKLRAIRRGAERRGLPKIWDHEAAPNPAPVGTTAIRFTALLSTVMSWTIEIYNDLAPTTPYRTLSGQGSAIDVTWDRRPDTIDPLDPDATAPPGTYTVIFRASTGPATARDATLSLTLE